MEGSPTCSPGPGLKLGRDGVVQLLSTGAFNLTCCLFVVASHQQVLCKFCKMATEVHC